MPLFSTKAANSQAPFSLGKLGAGVDTIYRLSPGRSLANFFLSALEDEADLSVLKSANPESTQADTDVTYTIELRNNGPSAAANVILNDMVPAGMTFVSFTQNTGPAFSCDTSSVSLNRVISCSNALFDSGEVATFTLVAHIPAGTEGGTYFTNAATATTETPDPNEENNTGTASTVVVGKRADAAIFKTVLGSGTPRADTDVTYTIEVRNNGPDPAQNLNWQDTLPATMTLVSFTQNSGPPMSCTEPAQGAGGTINCSIASLPANTTATFTLVAHIPADTADGTEFINTATVASDWQDPIEENNSSSVLVTVVSCDLTYFVTTSADSGPGSLRQGLLDVCEGGIILFAGTLPSPVTLTSGELQVTKRVTIEGPGANLMGIRRAAGAPDFRILTISPNIEVTISGLSISNGRVSGPGGGILNAGGNLTLINSAVTGNSSSEGFGIYNSASATGSTATLTIINSIINGNSGIGLTGDGGGIFNSAQGQNSTATLTLTNSTISGNTVNSGSGGGIANRANNTGATATATITNATITNNTATDGGGLISSTGGGGGTAITRLRNTIVSGNLETGSTNPDNISGTVDAANSSFNLIGSGGSGGLTDGVNNNQVGVDNPGLAPLASNGGPTQTHALLPGSPAMDRGSNALLPVDTYDLDTDGNTSEPLPVDQRGPNFMRVTDSAIDDNTTQTVDIGAFEAQVSVEDITDKVTQEDTPLSFSFKVGDVSLITSVTATSSNPSLVPNSPDNLSITGTGSTRTLQITPVAQQSGTTIITVTVNGFNSQAMTDTFMLTVTPVNDPPTVVGAGIPDVTVNEDAPNTQINLPTYFADVDDATLVYTVRGNTNPGLFTSVNINGAGVLTLDYAPDASGIADITIRATDAGSAFVEDTFRVTVNAVNDVPQAANDSYTTNEQTPLNVPAPGVLANDTDPEGSSLTAVLVSGPSNGELHLNADGSFYYIPNAGFSGTDSFTYKANDSTLDSSNATVTITVNEGGTLQFSSATYSVAENGGHAVITITRTGGTAGSATVLFFTSAGTAESGDFTTVSQVLTFQEGETSKTIQIPITDDAIDEPDETVELKLSQASGTGQLGTPSSAILTINDNETTPSISINNATVAEGNSGTTNAIFTVTLSEVSGQVVTVDFSVANGTATSGSDYQLTSGVLTFIPGDLTKTISVPVNGDTANEPDETFFVNLTNVQNASLSDNQGLGTITNDDTPFVQFRQSNYQINEGATNTPQGFASLAVEVVRGGDTSGAARVKYITSDLSGGNECNQVTGQASQRCDYATTAGTLRFAAGETSKTINIPIINDGYTEGNEFFFIQLQSPVGVSLGTTGQATLMIEDNDTVPTTPGQNPYLNNNFFVRQNYLDYLYREPDQAGFNDWVSVLNNCGPEKGFLGAPENCDRAHVVHGFFASPEHINSGFLVYRLYEVGMGRLPRYNEFVPDMASLSGFGIPDAIKQQNLADYLEEFAAKPEFTSRFNDSLLPSQAGTLISKLEQAAGITLPATATTRAGQPPQYGRQELINLRANGTLTLGQTLKAFVEQQPVYDNYFERGHVTLLYFAHLRRDPDLNDPNLLGWKDWVDVFTNGRPSAGVAPRDINHLIFGFIYSEEYRKRFGQP